LVTPISPVTAADLDCRRCQKRRFISHDVLASVQIEPAGLIDSDFSMLQRHVFMTPRRIDKASHKGEQTMNKDQVKGRSKEAKGKAKEAIGKITGDKSTENKGKLEKNVGKAQAAYGDIKNDVRKST
jgi:uncharacterized protein YjbJ (UPF0337 family)